MIYSSVSAELSFIGNGAKVTVQSDSAVFSKIATFKAAMFSIVLFVILMYLLVWLCCGI